LRVWTARLFTIEANTPLGRSTVGQGKTPLKRKEGRVGSSWLGRSPAGVVK
jgi:hypothetical protein